MFSRMIFASFHQGKEEDPCLLILFSKDHTACVSRLEAAPTGGLESSIAKAKKPLPPYGRKRLNMFVSFPSASIGNLAFLFCALPLHSLCSLPSHREEHSDQRQSSRRRHHPPLGHRRYGRNPPIRERADCETLRLTMGAHAVLNERDDYSRVSLAIDIYEFPSFEGLLNNLIALTGIEAGSCTT